MAARIGVVAMAVAALLVCLALHGAQAARSPPPRRAPPPRRPPPRASAGSFLTLADLPSGPTGTGKARVVGTFPFTHPQGLRAFNPFLTDAEKALVPNGAQCANKTVTMPCWETPATWSATSFTPKKDPTGALRLIGLTDRGPNYSGCNGGVGFSVPQFAPTLLELSFDKASGTAQLRDTCVFKDLTGKPITGLPNSLYDRDLPLGPSCEPPTAERYGPYFAAGGYDPRALDPESIVVIPGSDGLCLGSEEYGPSIYVIDCNFGKPSCGTVHVRYVPKGSDLPGIVPTTAYKVVEALPAALLQKRPNRGFENIAVSPSGKIAFAHLQSSMGLYAYNTNFTASRQSHVLLSVRLDLTDPLAAKTTGMFAYLGDRMDATNQSMWLRATRADINKLSETVWVTAEAGAPAEAPVMLVLERATAQVKVYVTDYSNATDLLERYDAPGADPLMLDMIWGKGYDDGKAQFDAMGVIPAKKALLINTGNVGDRADKAAIEGWTGTEKQEALLPMNKCVLALGDDNDFGVEAGPGVMQFVQLGRCIDEVYRSMA